MKRVLVIALACALACLVAFVGCGDRTLEAIVGKATDAGNAEVAFDATLDDASETSCTLGAACGDGGTCTLSGACCEPAIRACGTECCGVGATCLFGRCVTPSSPCTSNRDCKSGQYCEPALADGGAPVVDALCSDPRPLAGRCVDRCAMLGDAGAEAGDAGGCSELCEWKPKSASDKLSPVAQWSWGAGEKLVPEAIDVWSTPTVGRIADTNCDGAIDDLDTPQVVFVAGDARGTTCDATKRALGDAGRITNCQTGALRAIDGRDGHLLWSVRNFNVGTASFLGFAGSSVALADVDADGRLDVIAIATNDRGDGHVVVLDGRGVVRRVSDLPIPGSQADDFGLEGGLSVADTNHDGTVEIAFGASVFTATADGKLLLRFSKPHPDALSVFVDLDGKPDASGKLDLELLVGANAYRPNGTPLWNRPDLGPGHVAVADFNKDGRPEVVFVGRTTTAMPAPALWVLSGLDGKTILGPFVLPGTGEPGPPTLADFDGLTEPGLGRKPEIGVATGGFYSVVKFAYPAAPALPAAALAWKTSIHALPTSHFTATAFDFEADGFAEVILEDECFLWVLDGRTGRTRFVTPTSSFGGTGAPIVADVDGDGRAEIVTIASGADPVDFKCAIAPWNAAVATAGYERPAWKPPIGATTHRGVTLLSDVAHGWVGTRALWNQHMHHVTHVCDGRDGACDVAINVHGSIPALPKRHWTLNWANAFRQSVSDKGVLDAADATVSLVVRCNPLAVEVSIRNVGAAPLPAGIDVGIFRATSKTPIGKVTSRRRLQPGEIETVDPVSLEGAGILAGELLYGVVLEDLAKPTFRECRTTNNESPPAAAFCVK